MHLIDRIAHGSRWARHPTPEKLLLCFGGLAVCLIGPPLTTAPAVLLLNVIIALAAARLPARVFLAVLSLPIGFLLASLPMLLISLDLTNGFRLGWRPDQLGIALELAARTAGATSCLVLLALTTPAHAMIPYLRRIGVPAFLVEIMLLTYRLVFVFAGAVSTGYAAQTARLGYVGFRRSLHAFGMLAAAFFQRAMDKARRLETGLAARGFEGDLAVLPEDAPPVSPLRCLFTATALSAILAFGFLAERFLHV